MADPKRLMVVHLISSSGFYGGEKVVVNICQTFVEHRFTVVCLSRPSDDISAFRDAALKTNNVDFIRVDNSIFPVLVLLWKLYRSQSLQVMHAHGYKESFIACFLRLILKFRLIVTQHGFTERNLKSKLYNLINKCCCRWGEVDRVIAVSAQIQLIYENFGVPKNRLIYLQNGVVTGVSSKEKRLADRKGLRETLDLATEAPVILFAGRLSAEKDPFLFLSVFALLKKKMPESHAIIAGDGPMKAELLGRIAELELTECVSVLGFVAEMDPLLTGSDVLLLTSTTEGTPMVVLESLARGLAVIASGVGDIPGIIGGEESGVVVNSRKADDYFDACMRIFQDPQFCETIRENGRKVVKKHFDLALQRDSYLQIYGG